MYKCKTALNPKQTQFINTPTTKPELTLNGCSKLERDKEGKTIQRKDCSELKTDNMSFA